MNAAVLERDMFAPRQPPGMRSGLALAVLAHVLLIIALAWSVNWKSSEPEGIVAELWSALPLVAICLNRCIVLLTDCRAPSAVFNQRCASSAEC